MKKMPILAIASATVLSSMLAASPRAAQAQTAEEREVITVVERFFQGMAARDTAMMKSTVDPAARLTAANTQNGVTTIRPIPMANFITNVGNSPPDRGDLIERIYSPEVRIDGDLAQVWTFYTFHLGETFSHCGYDAFHLLRTHEGWKIVNVADSRRTTNCDPPMKR